MVCHTVGDPTAVAGLGGTPEGDVTIADLEEQARTQTDTAAAREMQAAKQKLFASFRPRLSA